MKLHSQQLTFRPGASEPAERVRPQYIANNEQACNMAEKSNARSIYQPRSILVTGGAGFIGSNYIHYALKHDPHLKIINLDNLTYAGNLNNLKSLSHPNRHHFICGDIKDASLVKHVLQNHYVDTIVHFAAESHVDRSIENPAAFVETNLLGTFILLEAARHHWFEVENCEPQDCRFYHVTTDEVYGSLELDDPLFTEKTSYNPRSPYSATKAGSDHLVNSYFHTYGLPTIISNCSNNYGPYQHSEKFIPTVIRACINWQKIPIYGNGKNIRDWLYVEDHCSGIMHLLQHGKVGEKYNLGANNEWENLKLAKYICAQFDQIKPRSEPYTSLLEFVTDRAGHDFRYAIDSGKIENELGWKANTTMEDGIKKTIKFYLEINKLATILRKNNVI